MAQTSTFDIENRLVGLFSPIIILQPRSVPEARDLLRAVAWLAHVVRPLPRTAPHFPISTGDLQNGTWTHAKVPSEHFSMAIPRGASSAATCALAELLSADAGRLVASRSCGFEERLSCLRIPIPYSRKAPMVMQRTAALILLSMQEYISCRCSDFTALSAVFVARRDGRFRRNQRLANMHSGSRVASNASRSLKPHRIWALSEQAYSSRRTCLGYSNDSAVGLTLLERPWRSAAPASEVFDPVWAPARWLIRTADASSDGELAKVEFSGVELSFGRPHMVGHRASLAGAIFKACKAHNSITFHWATTVTDVSSFSPIVRFMAQPRDSAAYKVEADSCLVPTASRVQCANAVRDPGRCGTSRAARRKCVTRWIADKRFVIAYPVQSNDIYNIVTFQPDANFAAAPSSTYTTKGSKSAMLELFSDFCPRVQRMLQLVPEGELCEWRIRVHAPLPTWVHGCVSLVGDACHPTLPHLAQAAAQSIEDAAVLAICLERCPSRSQNDIQIALRVYQALRKQRTETLVEMAAVSGRAMMLSDGEEKAKRDAEFAALKAGKPARKCRISGRPQEERFNELWRQFEVLPVKDADRQPRSMWQYDKHDQEQLRATGGFTLPGPALRCTTHDLEC
ncbi:hypothetical protein MRB53_041890 [Persea americana]|nr:hypothetical protein MRB53_041890 [Persea americana]